MKHVFRTALTIGLLSMAFCSYAETRAEKVDRLYKFFSIQELDEYQVQSAVLRAQNSAKQAAQEALAKVPAGSHRDAARKAEAALAEFNEKVSALAKVPASSRWKALLEEQLSDADLDNAVAFFLSPAGGRFMGTKGLADSVTSTALKVEFQRIIGPATQALEANLKSLPTK